MPLRCESGGRRSRAGHPAAANHPAEPGSAGQRGHDRRDAIQGRRDDGLLEGGAGLVAMVTTVLGNPEYGLSKVRRIGMSDVFCIVANHDLVLEAHHAAMVDIVYAALELVRGSD